MGVGGDEDLVEHGARARSFVDPGQHGAAGDLAQDLARQASGGETGGDDGEGRGVRHCFMVCPKRLEFD